MFPAEIFDPFYDMFIDMFFSQKIKHDSYLWSGLRLA